VNNLGQNYYTIAEVASHLKLSYNTVKRLVADDPDVLRLDRPETRSKRGYTTRRIPQAAYHRLIERLRVA
jgi:hypothetical protein